MSLGLNRATCKLLPSAHAIDREYDIMQALSTTDVPVPKMFGLCEDPEVIGTAFYLMEYITGRILWDPTLPDMTPEQRPAHCQHGQTHVLATGPFARCRCHGHRPRRLPPRQPDVAPDRTARTTQCGNRPLSSSPPLTTPTSRKRWSTTPLYESKTGCILRFERLAAFESNRRRSIP